MSSWVETQSANFTARHDDADAGDAAEVLELLESTRERLAPAFGTLPDEVAVVLHGSEGQLLLARPELPLRRALVAPAARRYLVGGVTGRELHVLAPPRLAARASSVPGSREMLMLSPAALYVRLVILAGSPALRRVARQIRWAWLVDGAAAWFSGQTQHARPAIVRRLREGGQPSYPPDRRDAFLLGGTVIDHLAREEGEGAAVELTRQLGTGGPKQALVRAFHGRSLEHSEGTWRAHLAHMAGSAR